MHRLYLLIAAITLTLVSPALRAQSMPATTTAPRAAKLPFTISKETTAITSPLKLDGTPDYVAALNQKYSAGITLENNGFVVWLHAVGFDPQADPEIRDGVIAALNVRDLQESPWLSYEDYLAKTLERAATETEVRELYRAQEHVWQEKDHPRVAAYLRAMEPQLNKIVEASQKPRWYQPKIIGSEGYLKLYSVGRIRETGDVLAARAALRAAGDFDDFMSDALAVKRLARLLGSGAIYFERLVAYALDGVANRTIGVVAGAGILNEKQSKSLRAALASLPGVPDLAECVDVGLRWEMLEHMITWIQIKPDLSSLNPFDDTLPPLKTVERGALNYDVMLKLINAQHDALVEALRAPDWPDETRKIGEVFAQYYLSDREIDRRNHGKLWMNAGEDPTAYSQYVAKFFLSLISPPIGRPAEIERTARVKSMLLDTLLAASAYHASHRAWPQTLEDLRPALLNALPIDPFSGQPVKLLARGSGLCIYSVGLNQKDEEGISDPVQQARPPGRDDIAIGAI